MADIDQQTTESGNGEDGSEGGFSEAFTARAAGEEAPPTDEAQASSSTEGAADQAASDEAPEQSAADDTSGTKPEGFDPWADLKPEQKTYFEKLHASERSNRGRVGALTKKLNGMTQGTPRPPEQGSTDQSQGNGESQAAEQSAAEALEAKLDAVAEEYGDVLGPLPELVKELRKEITDLKASKNRDEVDADAEALAEAYDRLGEAHPDYQEIAGSREFHQWIGQQPQKVQALLNSYDPAEVSLGLKLYKVESGIGANPGGSDQGDTGGATGDRRERQLGGLRQATTRGAPATSGVPNDFGAAFKSRAKAQG